MRADEPDLVAGPVPGQGLGQGGIDPGRIPGARDYDVRLVGEVCLVSLQNSGVGPAARNAGRPVVGEAPVAA